MDHNDSSCEWNYQASVRNKIIMDKHPESDTFHRQHSLGLMKTYKILKQPPTLTKRTLVDKITYPYIQMTSQILGGDFSLVKVFFSTRIHI